jgi:hypothetical protein
MVRIIHTNTVHHCPMRNKGPIQCFRPKGAKYCHSHSKVCVKHPDTAYLNDDKCPTCVQEAKLIAQREYQEREANRDPVGEMKRLKKEAIKAAAEEKKMKKRQSAFVKVDVEKG